RQTSSPTFLGWQWQQIQTWSIPGVSPAVRDHPGGFLITDKAWLPSTLEPAQSIHSWSQFLPPTAAQAHQQGQSSTAVRIFSLQPPSRPCSFLSPKTVPSLAGTLGFSPLRLS